LVYNERKVIGFLVQNDLTHSAVNFTFNYFGTYRILISTR